MIKKNCNWSSPFTHQQTSKTEIRKKKKLNSFAVVFPFPYRMSNIQKAMNSHPPFRAFRSLQAVSFWCTLCSQGRWCGTWWFWQVSMGVVFLKEVSNRWGFCLAIGLKNDIIDFPWSIMDMCLVETKLWFGVSPLLSGWLSSDDHSWLAGWLAVWQRWPS